MKCEQRCISATAYGEACLQLIPRRKCEVCMVIHVSAKQQFVDGIRNSLVVNSQQNSPYIVATNNDTDKCKCEYCGSHYCGRPAHFSMPVKKMSVNNAFLILYFLPVNKYFKMSIRNAHCLVFQTNITHSTFDISLSSSTLLICNRLKFTMASFSSR